MTQSSAICLPVLLLVLTISSPLSADDFDQIVTLTARQAQIERGLRFLENPERLGFPKLGRKASWRLTGVPPGQYHLDIMYSSGNGPPGRLCGVIRVTVGKAQYKVAVRSTGSWGTAGIVSLERVAIGKGSGELSVCVTWRAKGVGTALDLRSVELIPRKAGIKEAGKIETKRTDHGRFIQYIPRTLKKPAEILVLIHGTTGAEETALHVARRFITGFIPAAKKRGVVLVAPAFDQRNFGGHAGPGGGYRGMFGREVRADQFVNEILASYRKMLPSFDGKIYLYGHSAGGQFVSRYAVMHPERLRAAVISAAGSYAFPNPEAPWADGMKPLRRTMFWHETTERKSVDIRPDPNGWLEASMVPITVLVGDLDDIRVRETPHQPGGTRAARAKLWVEQMNALAKSHGAVGQVRLVVVRGVGHNSAQLLPQGISCLFDERGVQAGEIPHHMRTSGARTE